MAFLSLNNLAKYKNNKTNSKIALVINNQDPKMKGRIKVKLEGMFDPNDEKGSNLPWINRYKNSSFISNDIEEFCVPAVGSYVELVWPFSKSKKTFYKNAPVENEQLLSNFRSNYANEWGWADGSGFAFVINKSQKTFKIKIGASIITGDNTKIVINAANVELGSNTVIDGRNFMQHSHTIPNGSTTGGVV